MSYFRGGVASRGFSLIEILSVIFIGAVFASLVLPSASNFFNSQIVAAEASKLTADVRFAQSWAIQNQTYTRIAFANNPPRWIVQEVVDASGNSLSGEIQDSSAVNEGKTYSENPTYWRSIIETPIREIDPNVQLIFTPNNPLPAFFRPDGMLVMYPVSSAPPY